MIEAFFSNIYAILGAVLLACFGGYIAWRNGYKTRRANASSAFRAAVLAALDGIFPPVTRWGEGISTDLRATIPAVKSACVAFSPYVSRLKRRNFERAYAAYEQQCRQDHPFRFLVAHALAPADFPENPQTVFSTHVQSLLSFANET